MTRSVTFRVVGVAQPKGSTKAFVPRGWRRPIVTADNPRARDWQHCVSMTAQTQAREGLFLGPVALRVSFALPRPASLPRRIVAHVRRPDCDKILRCVCDALTGVLYRDDAQVVELHARKVYAALGEAPHADITVAEAAPFAALPTTEGWLFEEA